MPEPKWPSGPYWVDPQAENHVVATARPICSVSYSNTALPDNGRSENAAIAKLLAAAPELYELIEDLLDVWDPEWEPGKSLHERAVALLAKARGETDA